MQNVEMCGGPLEELEFCTEEKLSFCQSCGYYVVIYI